MLERTESPLDTFGAVRVEGELLEDDSIKLAALLKGVGYSITVRSDARMTVNWPGEEGLEWAYKGTERSTGYYLLRHYETTVQDEPAANPLGLKFKPLDELIKVFPKPHLVPKPERTADQLDQLNPLQQLLRRQNQLQP
ncbi:hypothetical protein D3C81_1604970 [compost metagenome]